MQISLVVAATENNVIGKDNQLLWRLPNDMRFFKNTTWAMPVIMGRKTFDSLGKPLKGRTNIVISRQPGWSVNDVKVVSDMEQAISIAETVDAKEAFVIGGGEIFRQVMDKASKIYMTRIHTVLDGDTFFPTIEPAMWKLVSNMEFSADQKHAYPYTFQVWERRESNI